MISKIRVDKATDFYYLCKTLKQKNKVWVLKNQNKLDEGIIIYY